MYGYTKRGAEALHGASGLSFLEINKGREYMSSAFFVNDDCVIR